MMGRLVWVSRGTLARVAILAAMTSAFAAAAMAQGGRGPGPGSAAPRGQFGGPGSIPLAQGLRTNVPPPPMNGDGTSPMRGRLQLGPPGRWWDDKGFAKVLKLDSAQQHRMDDAFNANKPTLLRLSKSLAHEESELEKVSHGKTPDETQILQQIDRVTQARGELEKAYAHTLLAIRKEMTDEQISRLEENRE